MATAMVTEAARRLEPDRVTDVQTMKRQMVRDEIIRSAAGLFAEHGVKEVSLAKVAGSLGYTKSSVYYYFNNKEDLLWAVFTLISDHFVDSAEKISREYPDPLERLEQLIRMHVNLLITCTEWTTVFYRDVSALSDERQQEVHRISVRYDAVFRQAVLDGTANGQMQPIPAEIAVNAVLGACNWMANWISPRHREQKDEIANTYVQLFLNGVVAQENSVVTLERSQPRQSRANSA
jgi:TetR/AcrR family transcriptional regulator, cholesterol catabolism regulator